LERGELNREEKISIAVEKPEGLTAAFRRNRSSRYVRRSDGSPRKNRRGESFESRARSKVQKEDFGHSTWGKRKKEKPYLKKKKNKGRPAMQDKRAIVLSSRIAPPKI